MNPIELHPYLASYAVALNVSELGSFHSTDGTGEVWRWYDVFIRPNSMLNAHQWGVDPGQVNGYLHKFTSKSKKPVKHGTYPVLLVGRPGFVESPVPGNLRHTDGWVLLLGDSD